MRQMLFAILGISAFSSANAQTVDSTELMPAQTEAIVDAVGSNLKDPYSAHYKLPATGVPKVVDGGRSVLYPRYCGCVNSKNSYGAYTGFKLFSGLLVEKTDIGKTEFIFFGIGDTEKKAATERKLCADAGAATSC